MESFFLVQLAKFAEKERHRVALSYTTPLRVDRIFYLMKT